MRDDSQAVGDLFQHLRATALTFASVANGVALGLVVYQTIQFNSGAQYFYFLNFCTFVLMVRFWWRYVIFVSYYAPSRSLDQYCVDFAIAAIGIAAVFFFNRPDIWALCYAAVYLLAAVKAWQLTATLRKILKYLATAAAFGMIWLFFYVTGNNKTLVVLCAVLLLVVSFYNIWKKVRHGLVVPKLRVPLDPTAAFQDGTQPAPRRAKKKGRVKNKEMKKKSK